jgi:hypothetical protein
MTERIYLTNWSEGKKSASRKYPNTFYNRIRTFVENDVKYLKVELKDDHTMLCDVQDYELIQSRIWSVRKYKGGKNYYCEGNKESFHRKIYPGPYVGHVNRNSLDNRRKNLRYKRDMNRWLGVRLNYDQNKMRWIVCWNENKKQRYRYFHGVEDEVKQQAIKFKTRIESKKKNFYLCIKNILN